jgi:hypothetical protein
MDIGFLERDPERQFIAAPVAVEFYECPRILTNGTPFVGVRLVGRDLTDCAKGICGVGYTKRTALLDLRDDVQAMGASGPGVLMRAEAIALVKKAISETPAQVEPAAHNYAHAAAQAVYRPGKGHKA